MELYVHWGAPPCCSCEFLWTLLCKLNSIHSCGLLLVQGVQVDSKISTALYSFMSSSIFAAVRWGLAEGAIEFRECLGATRYLQPILLIITLGPFNDMKCIDYSSFLTQVLLALVKQIAVDQNQSPSLDFTKHVV